jgi:hypothetical protein
MIEVMLTIMLLGVDALALYILRLMQAGALAARHDAIGLGAIFHVVDMLLAALEAIGFALCQSARGNALINALFLIGLTLIDTRRIGLGKSQRRQNKGKDSKGLDDFHVFSPDD